MKNLSASPWYLALFLLFAAMLPNQPSLGADAGAEGRVQYLDSLMKALRAMPKAEYGRLLEESQKVFSGLCRSSDPGLALSCAFDSAEKICKASLDQASCLLAMDALIVERLNANRFVSPRERYEMMSQGSDYREKIAKTIQFRYGTIALAFSLGDAARCQGGDFACLAKNLEHFCQIEARQGRQSYQSCASVLALYIGSRSQGQSELAH